MHVVKHMRAEVWICARQGHGRDSLGEEYTLTDFHQLERRLLSTLHVQLDRKMCLKNPDTVARWQHLTPQIIVVLNYVILFLKFCRNCNLV